MNTTLENLLKTVVANPEITCPKPNRDVRWCGDCRFNKGHSCDMNARTASYLAEHGVICPPCKIGDTLYIPLEGELLQGEVAKIEITVHPQGTEFAMRVPIENRDGHALRVVLEPKEYAIVAYRSEKEAVTAMREPSEHQNPLQFPKAKEERSQ